MTNHYFSPKERARHCRFVRFIKGNAKTEKAVADIKAEEINNDDGVKAITDKLDQIFLEQSVDEA